MSTESVFLDRRLGGYRWVVRRAFNDSLEAVLGRLTSETVSDRCVAFHGSRGRTCHRVADGWPGHGDVMAKRHAPRASVEYVKYVVQPTRAATEWRIGCRFEAAGIPTPLPLAWGERRVGGVWLGSILVVEGVFPGKTLGDFLTETRAPGAVMPVLEQAAKGVALIHNAGFHYRDLHGHNVLLRDRDGPPEVLFTDLHEVRPHGRVTRDMAIDDLGRLNSSVSTRRAFRLRFLEVYLRSRGIDTAELAAWRRDIDARTRAIWERSYRKRGVRVERY